MEASENKKVLVVAESIDVEDSSGSKANVALIMNLAQVGLIVEVYHYTRKEINLPNVACFEISEKKWNANFIASRAQRKLQHGLKINLAKYLEPLFGFSFTFFNDSRSISEGLEKVDFEPDLVITLSKGASFRPHHALLSLSRFHDKWMAYIHDPYPFHFYPQPYTWSEPGYQQKIRFFEEVAKKCRWAAFPSLLLQQWMEKKYPGFQGKGVVIPHQITKTGLGNTALPGWFDFEKFNLVHAGNLMKQRSPFFLIRAFQRFLELNPVAVNDSQLILVGNATYHEKELAFFEKQVPQITIADYIPYEQVQEIQKSASVNIILESQGELSPFLPGKFPHCIAAGKPILLLGPQISESKRLLGEEYLYWSRTTDVERITVLIEDLYQQWRTGSLQPSFEREKLLKYLSTERLQKELKQLL